MSISRESRIVKLKSNGVGARVSIISRQDQEMLSGYLFAISDEDYKAQIVRYFCDNLLQAVIPSLVGKSDEHKQEVFDELYKTIEMYNPVVCSFTRPISLQPTDEIVGGFTMFTWTSGAEDQELNERTKQEPKTAKQTRQSMPPIKSKQVGTISQALSKRIFGQDEALTAIQEAFEIAFSGLGDPERPRGVFMFVGDTGTGKTASVKELARHFWGKKWSSGLYVINGSEFMEDHEVAKLLGSPNGYVGYDDGSPFLKHMTKFPESIILVDEFEKASDRLQDVFLQIMDAGVCYDNRGNQIDFTDSVIIFTSNIGTKEAFHKNGLGFISRSGCDAIRTVHKAIEDTCRVEFIKRFDKVVIFNKLTEDDLHKVAVAEFNKVRDRLSERGVTLKASKKVFSWLVSKLDDDSARDIRALVNSEIVVPTAKQVITDDGVIEISVNVVDDKLEVLASGEGQ